MVLQCVLKCSYNGMLDHSGKSHDVAEQCDVERLERATDNLSNS